MFVAFLEKAYIHAGAKVEGFRGCGVVLRI